VQVSNTRKKETCARFWYQILEHVSPLFNKNYRGRHKV